MRQIKRHVMTLAAIRKMLEAGALSKDVSRASNYSVSELAIMCQIWSIPRRRGRRKLAVESDGK
jgi:hypothetical protein